ncbi:hypothetical protein ABZ713_24250, partial [Streptomyces sp. NPDC006875]
YARAVGGRFRSAPRAPSADADAGPPPHVVDRAAVVADAAMLAAGVQASRAGGAGPPARVGTLRSAETPHQMVRLSDALSTSPIVAEARRRAGARTAAAHD